MLYLHITFPLNIIVVAIMFIASPLNIIVGKYQSVISTNLLHLGEMHRSVARRTSPNHFFSHLGEMHP